MMSKHKNSALNFDFDSLVYLLFIKKPTDSLTLYQKLIDYVKKYEGYSVALSGGYDSQFVCLILKEAGIDFDVISYKLTWDDEVINANDVLSCENFCKKHNLKLNVMEIDGKEFFDGGIYASIGKKYKSHSPQISLHCYFLEQSKSQKILCGGDIPYPKYSPETKELSLKHLIFLDGEEGPSFLRRYDYPYRVVGLANNKTIVKNLFFSTPEIYYLSMTINEEIILENKVFPTNSPLVQNYRYKEMYYNHILKDNKLSFRFGEANGFENLQTHLAQITGNYNEFNDKYRKIFSYDKEAHITSRIKCASSDFEGINEKFKLLIQENDFEFLYDFKLNL